MAHLWMKNSDQNWAVMKLDGNAFTLTGDEIQPVRLRGSESECRAEGFVMASTCEDQIAWILLASGAQQRLRVNGVVFVAGIRVLRDRDELRLSSGQRMFFSTEILAHVEPFVGGDRPTFCPRCRQQIDSGRPAVRCPGCGAIHHQSEDDGFTCWAYAPRCALCDQSTDIATSYRWTPECL